MYFKKPIDQCKEEACHSEEISLVTTDGLECSTSTTDISLTTTLDDEVCELDVPSISLNEDGYSEDVVLLDADVHEEIGYLSPPVTPLHHNIKAETKSRLDVSESTFMEDDEDRLSSTDRFRDNASESGYESHPSPFSDYGLNGDNLWEESFIELFPSLA